MHAASFKDLLVYKKAMAVANNVFLLSKKFPREETFALTDQVRRSSRSIGAQIAEAWENGVMKNIFLANCLMPMVNRMRRNIGWELL